MDNEKFWEGLFLATGIFVCAVMIALIAIGISHLVKVS